MSTQPKSLLKLTSGLLLLALAGWSLWASGSTSREAGDEQVSAAAPSAFSAHPVDALLQPLDAARPVEAPRSAAAVRGGGSPIAFHVTDSAGRTIVDAAGEAELLLASGSTQDIEIHAGVAWLEQSLATDRPIRSLVLAGRQASVTRILRRDAGLRIQAEWMYPTRLELRSATTGEALVVEELRIQSPAHFRTDVVPSRRWTEPLEWQALPGPVAEFLPLTQESVLFVRGQGHAWTRFLAGPLSEELVVTSVPAGELVAELDPKDLPRSACALRLVEGERTLQVLELPDAGDLELSGVAPGELELVLETNHDRPDRLVLDRARVDVRPGGTTRVSLAYDPTAATRHGSLWLTAGVPSHLRRSDVRLRLFHEGDLDLPSEVRFEHFPSVTGEQFGTNIRAMQAGTWRAQLLPWGLESEFLIEAGGVTAHHVELPPTLSVRVLPVFEDAERPPSLLGLRWRQADLSASPAPWSVVPRNPITDEFRLDVLPGLVEIESLEAGLTVMNPQQPVFEESPLEVRLRPAERVGLDVQIVQEGRPLLLELQDWQHLRLETSTGEAVPVHKSFPHTERDASVGAWRSTWALPAPGDYVLIVDATLSGDRERTVPVRVEGEGRTTSTIDLSSS